MAIFPLIVLLAVFVLIAVRQIGDMRFQIWQIMLGGATCVLVTRQIGFKDALKAIDVDVMIFLFSMFVIGVALEESGYLGVISYRIFRRARSSDELLLLILLVTGFTAALLMNDTLAIIGTPIVIMLARKHGVSPKALLLALAFGITIGSALSPIGNPQNFLVATKGSIKNPFLVFIRYLFLPTVVNLIVAFLLLKLFFKEHFNDDPLNHSEAVISDIHLARLSKLSLILLIALILVKVFCSVIGFSNEIRLVYVTLFAALPLLLLSPKRWLLVKKVDWHTLVFFASMFVLMQSVWNTGFFQAVIQDLAIDIASIPMIILVSVVVSQFVSNVPLVALYLPMLSLAGVGTKELMALASGSTIAGNLTILGAASNIIIIHIAEKKYGETLSFLEFARIGIPLTVVNSLIYLTFLLMT